MSRAKEVLEKLGEAKAETSTLIRNRSYEDLYQVFEPLGKLAGIKAVSFGDIHNDDTVFDVFLIPEIRINQQDSTDKRGGLVSHTKIAFGDNKLSFVELKSSINNWLKKNVKGKFIITMPSKKTRTRKDGGSVSKEDYIDGPNHISLEIR